jgi:hypothetical protein
MALLGRGNCFNVSDVAGNRRTTLHACAKCRSMANTRPFPVTRIYTYPFRVVAAGGFRSCRDVANPSGSSRTRQIPVLSPVPSFCKPWSSCSAASSDPTPWLNFHLCISSCQTTRFCSEGIRAAISVHNSVQN